VLDLRAFEEDIDVRGVFRPSSSSKIGILTLPSFTLVLEIQTAAVEGRWDASRAGFLGISSLFLSAMMVSSLTMTMTTLVLEKNMGRSG